MQVRAFVKNIEGTGKQELNQSPLPFVETAAQPGKIAGPVQSLVEEVIFVRMSSLIQQYWFLCHVNVSPREFSIIVQGKV